MSNRWSEEEKERFKAIFLLPPYCIVTFYRTKQLSYKILHSNFLRLNFNNT
jgi:hypothetical protein